VDITLLREFLGKEKLVEDHEDFLLYFDGHLYWDFQLCPQGDLMLRADVEKTVSAFPVVETVIHHRCEITKGNLIGNEPPYERLTFWHPGSKEEPETQAPCMLTKTPEGRLSLAPHVWWEEE
jgi:hypothetical protein